MVEDARGPPRPPVADSACVERGGASAQQAVSARAHAHPRKPTQRLHPHPPWLLRDPNARAGVPDPLTMLTCAARGGSRPKTDRERGARTTARHGRARAAHSDAECPQRSSQSRSLCPSSPAQSQAGQSSSRQSTAKLPVISSHLLLLILILSATHHPTLSQLSNNPPRSF